jgi:hypothetical protein
VPVFLASLDVHNIPHSNLTLGRVPIFPVRFPAEQGVK